MSPCLAIRSFGYCRKNRPTGNCPTGTTNSGIADLGIPGPGITVPGMTDSGRQTLHDPAGATAAIAETVVQPGRSTLPELDFVR
jgi:hypothetical protein